MITIAVDAMGGDNAPRPEVEGSVLAARELGVRVMLVGQPQVVKAELARHDRSGLKIEIVPASEVITMDDHPAQAFRRKKDSSVHVATRLVREAKADGLVSAGNTGAVMTVARFLVGDVGVGGSRGAGCAVSECQGRCQRDVGRWRECGFKAGASGAVRGDGGNVLRATFGSRKPRVGLLSIGEEESKGNELTREVNERLKGAHMQYVGNVEGGDLFSGNVDVIVCDGFVGNIALKICEGLAMGIFGLLKKSLKSSLMSSLALCYRRGPSRY